MEERRHFTVIVAGEEPDTIIGKYDSNIKVPPYVVYEYSKVKEYRKQKEKYYEGIIHSNDIEEQYKEYFKEELSAIMDMDDMDFYIELTEGYTLDDKNGNAVSCVNPDGKYDICNRAKNFAVPFILKDGTEAFSARKKDIDWDKIHLANRKPYEVAWDTVMENKKPKDEEEEKIFLNMKERKYYFSLFGDRENYIKSNTAFWGYAFVSEDGWKELDGTVSQFKWVCDFYDSFIKPLSDDTLITIYECIRN